MLVYNPEEVLARLLAKTTKDENKGCSATIRNNNVLHEQCLLFGLTRVMHDLCPYLGVLELNRLDLALKHATCQGLQMEGTRERVQSHRTRHLMIYSYF